MSRASGSPQLFVTTTTFGALLVIAAAGWAFLVSSESAMRLMSGDGFVMDLMWLMMKPSDLGPYFFAAAVMWAAMMIAMMIPAVLPMAAVYRKIERDGFHAGPIDTFAFASGYLLAWCAFSVVAAGLQWWLHVNGWLEGMMLTAGTTLASVILLAAGLYQFTPLKEACLARCRSPLGFFLDHWQPGTLGALRMGIRHGWFCIGCCWMLMMLMFAGGAMSVVTMALLTAFIVGERLLPAGIWVTRIPGFVLCAVGVFLLSS
jgi:predicted metal-binding membrane protein